LCELLFGYFFSSLGYSGIDGLYGNSVFDFLMNGQTVFQSGYATLPFYQQ
jgi:hypothetical protein